MRDVFVDNLTYEAASSRAHLSLRGLYKRVKTLSDPMEEYLHTIN